MDNSLSYQFLTIFGYVIFLFKGYLAIEQNSAPIFPNPIFLLLMTLLMFVSGILRQIIDPTKIENKIIMKKVILSSLPPILGLIEIYSWVKNNRNKNIDVSIIAGMIVLGIVMGFISIAFIMLLILLYVYSSVSGQALYFIFIGMLAYLGIALSSSKLFYSSEIKINVKDRNSFVESLRYKSTLFWTRLFFTRSKRLIWGFSILFILLLISKISPQSLIPLTI